MWGMEQDHRQIARERFDRLMRVPEEVVFLLLFLVHTIPLFFMLDPPKTHELQAFLYFVVGSFAALVLYCVFRIVTAGVIALLAVRRARAAAADRPAGTPAVR